jgi:chromosome segregation ATPase
MTEKMTEMKANLEEIKATNVDLQGALTREETKLAEMTAAWEQEKKKVQGLEDDYDEACVKFQQLSEANRDLVQQNRDLAEENSELTDEKNASQQTGGSDAFEHLAQQMQAQQEAHEIDLQQIMQEQQEERERHQKSAERLITQIQNLSQITKDTHQRAAAAATAAAAEAEAAIASAAVVQEIQSTSRKHSIQSAACLSTVQAS